jgi:2-dehydropantoate 2-reductase
VRIAVIGAGAVGCLFGARLAAAGQEVHLVARPASVAVLRARGITVEGIRPGTWAITASAELPEDLRPEVVLLTTKTFDLASAASAAARRLGSPVPTLLPQNGLGVEALAAAAMRDAGWADPLRSLVRAVNTIPSMLIAPGVVRQPGEGELILADLPDTSASAGATRTIHRVLHASGLPVRTVPDLDRELWRKALVNAAINPVTALHGVPNGSLLDAPYRAEATALLREAQRAAASAGFVFENAEADRSLDQVVHATAGNRSSMLQDVERGRPTEIDAISGEIERVASAHGIELPATRAVVARLSSLRSARSDRAQPS